LSKALDVARRGDALVVWKLDRIGRSLPHVVGLVGDLQKRGIGLKVLTGDVDVTTATGRLVFGIFATLAEFERHLILVALLAGAVL
jgi:DNA invertase Pin-like site-specific DNA recombinase